MHITGYDSDVWRILVLEKPSERSTILKNVHHMALVHGAAILLIVIVPVQNPQL